MPRRGPPPPGYPGSSSNYYRPSRNWYPSTHWHYRPYYYDPYGWRHFGWSPLYYVPWSLVWGIHTPFFYGSVGFGYPGYGYPYYSGYPYYGGAGSGGSYTFETGGVRLRVRPRDAQVWVDGYYAGIVDDFDGTFQSLRLAPGGHKIEIRMQGFETLTFDVHVQPERTISFAEDMRPIP